MKLANRAYVATLILLMLVFAVTAQTTSHVKSEKDNRNTAPTVGTGGPAGGPTGLLVGKTAWRQKDLLRSINHNSPFGGT